MVAGPYIITIRAPGGVNKVRQGSVFVILAMFLWHGRIGRIGSYDMVVLKWRGLMLLGCGLWSSLIWCDGGGVPPIKV